MHMLNLYTYGTQNVEGTWYIRSAHNTPIAVPTQGSIAIRRDKCQNVILSKLSPYRKADHSRHIS